MSAVQTLNRKAFTMNDDQLLAMARQVLHQHFGINENGESRCAECDHVAWPCSAALLAQEVQVQVLAR